MHIGDGGGAAGPHPALVLGLAVASRGSWYVNGSSGSPAGGAQAGPALLLAGVAAWRCGRLAAGAEPSSGAGEAAAEVAAGLCCGGRAVPRRRVRGDCTGLGGRL